MKYRRKAKKEIFRSDTKRALAYLSIRKRHNETKHELQICAYDLKGTFFRTHVRIHLRSCYPFIVLSRDSYYFAYDKTIAHDIADALLLMWSVKTSMEIIP